MKRRGDPDRRGMGAQSDFISESFVPNVQHVAEQKARIRVLPASGLSAEEVAGIFSVPVDRVLEASSRAEGASE